MSDIISEPKKVLPLLILDTLKRCTNEENTLTQKEISDILMRECGGQILSALRLYEKQ